MNLRDPFKEPTPSPPKGRSPGVTCAMLLPAPKDSPPWVKSKVCGRRAYRKVRLGDGISSAEIDVCGRCKARHDAEAASRRHQDKANQARRKAG